MKIIYSDTYREKKQNDANKSSPIFRKLPGEIFTQHAKH